MLFKRKPIENIIEESGTKSNLKRSLGPIALIALGVGAIVGAGLFSVTGKAAGDYAGPGVMISFLIAAIGCAFAGLCYAEFASMIPVAGSAYTYSYATMGEFIAWIIGWDLVLEYSVASAAVASSWTGYFNQFLLSFNIHFPVELLKTPFEGGIINLPAAFIVIAMSLVLMRGTKGSASFNNFIVILKVSIVLIFIALGFKYINPENLTPLVPPNTTGKFGDFGWSGILRAAGIMFFAYIGFDAVSTAAQEAKNPKKNMPIGILGSLLICTILYITFAYVMTGIVNYTEFSNAGTESLAPVVIAINQMGNIGADGTIIPAYPWLNIFIVFSVLLGFSSIILVMLLGQSRVFFSMSQDGLIPKIFSQTHSKFKTPVKSNFIFMVFISACAGFIPGSVISEMTSIGTLFAFVLVCIGVIVLRKKNPNAPRGFKTPLVPLIPILGVLTCFGLMVSLPLDTWIRLVIWMILGFDIYLWYGIKKSIMAVKDTDNDRRKSYTITSYCGIFVSIILMILTYLHHKLSDGNDQILIYFSVIFCVINLLIFIYYIYKSKFNSK
ncbi:amino acid permease [Apibacter muscae]|uniref:amino acid permease n=1 Tax=Apibacter muscae TaxID=2509004 RepID=UPI0011ACC1F0|nr:amino acid permease [Apibacter muscae]TWP22803.1 amino acid permease [Apibacter muscae]TWP28160.1 amino acid permease [Apibacter muscae]